MKIYYYYCDESAEDIHVVALPDGWTMLDIQEEDAPVYLCPSCSGLAPLQTDVADRGQR